MKIRALAAPVAALCLCTSLGWALPSVHEVARQVDDHYNHLASLKADFTEIYQGSGMDRSESGTLWLKKPGKMRWDYRSPEEKLFIDDGRTGWLYLPAEKQVRKSAMRNLDDLRSPLAFLLGKTKLEKELTGLSFAPDVEVWHSGDVILRGVPRNMEDTVRQVLLEITPGNQIARIMLYATDDSVTEYRFSNQEENVPVLDSQFRFSPPAGIEVIEDEAGN
ncbi:MAG TPA: outer membrane lipoprotein chaperone LolA [Terriglobales bacterium]|nr:outer membrane lipoprotein chaperone LolA [Terriglobales bacterium]